MSIVTNIVKRGGSRNWYYRRAYPRDVAAALGKAEFMKSLGTPDLTLARERAPAAEFEFRQTISAIRRGSGPSQEEIKDWLRGLYEREIALLESTEFVPGVSRMAGEPDVGPMNDEYRKKLIITANTGDLNGASEWAVDEAIERYRWRVAPDSPAYRELALAAAQALLEARKRIRERQSGDWSGRPSAPKLADAVADRGKAKSEAGKEGLLDLYERYASESKHLRPDTVDQNRKILRRFVEFVGEDADVEALNRSVVREWKFKLSEWPAKASEASEFRDLGFNEVIEANRFVGRPTIGERTVAKYLAAVGSFSNWLVAHGFIEENPTRGLLPKRKARRSAASGRRPFSIEELNRLFRSPVFSLCGGDRREHEPGEVAVRDERYWLFPLALFTGARQAELCQLRRKDIRQQEDIWLIEIADDGEDALLKSDAAARIIPIHPELIRLGFVDYVRDLQLAPGERIFPRCRRNNRDQFGQTSKWLNAYLDKAGVRDDRHATFHSLRHCFIDALRRADFTEAEIQPLVGHAPSTVTRGYGRERDGTIRRRLEMVEAVTYEGLVLPSSYRSSSEDGSCRGGLQSKGR